jgi:hypothetical protein
VEAVTDRETFLAMLDRAGIPHREAPPGRGENGTPEGATAIQVGDLSWFDEPRRQPLCGGYSGFFSELVFAGDGHLLAVWAWE